MEIKKFKIQEKYELKLEYIKLSEKNILIYIKNPILI